MNTQLQLLGNESAKDPKEEKKAVSKKYSKRIIGHVELDNTSSDKPWKLSEKDRNQGLAGIAMIKQILASVPNNFENDGENQFAKAS